MNKMFKCYETNMICRLINMFRMFIKENLQKINGHVCMLKKKNIKINYSC